MGPFEHQNVLMQIFSELGFRHSVVSNIEDNNGECEGYLCPQGILFIGEFGPWCHLIKGHSRLGAGVAEKVRGCQKS